MRLFFAVELPPAIEAALGRLRPLDDVAWACGYRWVDPSLMHVTLAFLGEQPHDALEALRAIGTISARATRPGTFSIGGAKAFGPPRAPRVLWLGLLGDLRPLQEAQARLASELRTAGFRLEDRPFRPHITLARRRAQAAPGLPPPWPLARTPPLEVPLERLTLFDSKLGPRGARYTPLEHFPLAGH